MPRGIEAIVKPELIIWGRKSAGLTIEEAARKIGVTPDRLLEWEQGKIRPTIGKLQKMANVYKRPLAAFYLPEPPAIYEPLNDFRKITGIEETEYSPALRLELRKARYRREVAIELMEEMGEEIPGFTETASIDEDIDILAGRIRNLLDVSLEEQTNWQSGYQAFKSWRNAVEALFVLVFLTGSTKGSQIKLDEMRGLSMIEERLPVILINSADGINGRIFTLLHEFVHLFLHNGGICDLKENNKLASDEDQVEVFCNHVAGAILVPTDYLLSEGIVIGKQSEKTWADYELSRLANRFSVSQEVILRRLLILNRTTREFYEEKRKQFLEQYKKQKPSKGGPEHYILVMRDNGPTYTRLVLEAYYQDIITESDISNYLGMKLKHLKSIENEVMYMV